MANLALGLTKTAVEGTLIRVKSAIDEEAKLKVQVQDDLLFISGEFQMMQSFLKLANKERAKNEVVLTWVRQIRDLAFDVEDCVEFVIHLDKPSKWDTVRRLWSSVFVCMSGKQLPLDTAVAEIKQLRTRAEDISQRNTRYNLITNVKDVLPATAGNTSSTTTFHILSNVWKDMGKKRQIKGGLKMLIKNEGRRLEVISLWGSTSTAHLGVTHAFREAWDDPEICTQFTCRAWIKLTHPFNHDDFMNSLLTQLYATSSHHQATSEPSFRTTEEYHLMKTELMQKVRHERYLIILEDLFSVAEWDVIRMYLPDSNNGSRIIVATRQLGLALPRTGEPYQVSNLREFSDGQSLCAFFSSVCGHNSFMAEFMCSLRRPGVTSVFREYEEESGHLVTVYTSIVEKSKEFLFSKWGKVRRTLHQNHAYSLLLRLLKFKEFGVSDFERHVWLDVTPEFVFEDFYRRLLSNLKPDAAAVGAVDIMKVKAECDTILDEHKCLIVLNGLCLDHWTMMKDTLFCEPIKCSILVITDEETVARFCVHSEDRAFQNKYFEGSATFGDSRQEECSLNLGGHFSSQSLSGKKLEAFEWTEKFKLVGHQNEWTDLCHQLKGNAGVISVWGSEGVGQTSLVKHIYYTNITGASQYHSEMKIHERGCLDGVTKYSWVNVVYPFDLTDLSRSLLLDFHSHNFEAKETAAIDMMEGKDQFQECRNIMHQFKCFIVICGLRSTQDWDLIHAAFLSEPIGGYILVITNAASVASHCAGDRVIKVKGLEADVTLQHFKKVKYAMPLFPVDAVSFTSPTSPPFC